MGLTISTVKWPKGTVRNYDGYGNENVEKAVSLMSKTKTLHLHHAFLYISLPSRHNYNVKWPNFEVTWEREQQGGKFHFEFGRGGPLSSVLTSLKWLGDLV